MAVAVRSHRLEQGRLNNFDFIPATGSYAALNYVADSCLIWLYDEGVDILLVVRCDKGG